MAYSLYGPDPDERLGEDRRERPKNGSARMHGWMALRQAVRAALSDSGATLAENDLYLRYDIWEDLVNQHSFRRLMTNVDPAGKNVQCMKRVLGRYMHLNNPPYPTDQQPVRWQWGPVIRANESVPDDIAHFVLWELCEINFRMELRALDQAYSGCNVATMSTRLNMIRECFPDQALIPDVEHTSIGGLASEDPDLGMMHVHALLRLMAVWRIEGDEVLDDVARRILAGTSGLSNTECTHHAIDLYVRSAVRLFGRAPFAPRVKPTRV